VVTPLVTPMVTPVTPKAAAPSDSLDSDVVILE